MGSVLVVELDPKGNLELSVGEIKEDLGVEAFASECTDEAFGKAVLPRTARLDERVTNAFALKIEPNGPGCKLWPVVTANMVRLAMFNESSF